MPIRMRREYPLTPQILPHMIGQQTLQIVHITSRPNLLPHSDLALPIVKGSTHLHSI